MPKTLTCHLDGVVAQQRVGTGEPTRVNSRVLVRHVDDAQHPVADPRSVGRQQPSIVFKPGDGLRGVFYFTGYFQRVAQAQNHVLQEGCFTGRRV